jgi:polyphosphate kinase
MSPSVRREAENARAGRPSGIRAKMNQLQDGAMIRELYGASQAGVPIALNIRGLCCLRAGVPGLSESIRVYSTWPASPCRSTRCRSCG